MRRTNEWPGEWPRAGAGGDGHRSNGKRQALTACAAKSVWILVQALHHACEVRERNSSARNSSNDTALTAATRVLARGLSAWP